ncbi:hypothetical protein BDZ89DRAFT_1045047 [Hymenopellis radicata]|nr:hypothetical protein BDZ89DRAFT_1045047 [Hymenopellis radicata]
MSSKLTADANPLMAAATRVTQQFNVDLANLPEMMDMTTETITDNVNTVNASSLRLLVEAENASSSLSVCSTVLQTPIPDSSSAPTSNPAPGETIIASEPINYANSSRQHIRPRARQQKSCPRQHASTRHSPVPPPIAPLRPSNYSLHVLIRILRILSTSLSSRPRIPHFPMAVPWNQILLLYSIGYEHPDASTLEAASSVKQNCSVVPPSHSNGVSVFATSRTE